MDSPGGSMLFESYEQDYEVIKVSITERLNASWSQNGEPRKQTLRAVDREVDEAAATYGSGNIKSPSGISNTSSTKATSTQKRVQTTSRSTSDRDELLGGFGGESDLDAATMDQRTRLLNGADRLTESSRRLHNSHKIALETGKASISAVCLYDRY
ncbi:hypothetical protein FBU30_008434 [Linnemannia zychae]|nr:hypothetical protein FBU30_008434 [Linnemannia zychae]